LSAKDLSFNEESSAEGEELSKRYAADNSIDEVGNLPKFQHLSFLSIIVYMIEPSIDSILLLFLAITRRKKMEDASFLHIHMVGRHSPQK
jgi:hypothetical protein